MAIEPSFSNVEKPGEKRLQEMQELYGEGATKIFAMETAVQLSFQKCYDQKAPKLWPTLPLNIKFDWPTDVLNNNPDGNRLGFSEVFNGASPKKQINGPRWLVFKRLPRQLLWHWNAGMIATWIRTSSTPPWWCRAPRQGSRKSPRLSWGALPSGTRLRHSRDRPASTQPWIPWGRRSGCCSCRVPRRMSWGSDGCTCYCQKGCP